jgi:hypothetical protein
MYRRFPDIGNATAIVRPETIIRWFRAWWRWKSHNPGGRPGIDQEVRDLVRSMCKENPLWGAPRIHAELLKLGFNIWGSWMAPWRALLEEILSGRTRDENIFHIAGWPAQDRCSRA